MRGYLDFLFTPKKLTACHECSEVIPVACASVVSGRTLCVLCEIDDEIQKAKETGR